MTTAYDVPPEPLLKAIATRLQTDAKFAAPDWAKMAKTGAHREKAPYVANWWPTRVASLLRRVYIEGPIGVVHLSGFYGGTRDRGSKPNRSSNGSRSIVRAAVHQMESAGLLSAIKGRGRVLTGAGRKLVDSAAHEVAQQLEVKIPGLKKY